MNLPPPLPPPPQHDDPIIMQFRPVDGQWELTEDNINRIDPETGHTILHNYCKYINTTPIEVFQYLIETLGCDVNVQDKYNNTPLPYALYCFNPNDGGGNIAVLMYLLTQMAVNVNINIRNQNDTTLLHFACDNINTLPLDVFKVLIETLGCDVNAQDNGKNTPLHYVLYRFNPNDGGGDINVLDYLLNQKGVDGNINNIDDTTLLHTACSKINTLPLEVFQYLIGTLGCDVNAQDDNWNSPLHYALCCFSPNYGGNISVLTYLLHQEKVNGNIKDEYGEILLHAAYSNINNLPLEIFEVLMKIEGCDINAQDRDTNTPLHYAIGRFDPRNGGNITVLHYLLAQKGINANIKGLFGGTFLHKACENINALPLEIFKVLIETLGCDINAQDDKNNTPLHYALENFNPNDGDINALTYLINQKNVDVNINNIDDTALLHSACNNINNLSLGIFKCLIETMGSDINAQDDKSNTPLHYALENFNPNDGGDINALAYLLSQDNVDVNPTCDNYRIILHKACTRHPLSLPNSRSSDDVDNLNAECDSILCQFVGMIAERCAQHILDEMS
jgi:ankyrin repeat protein